MSLEYNPTYRNAKLLYYRYRESPFFSLGIFSVVIIICLALIFSLIIPQAQNWFSIQREIAETRERTRIINNNIGLLNNLSDTLLDKDLQVAVSALPQGKDFSGILNAVSTAAVNSSVTLEDFSLELGVLATSSATRTISSIQLLLTVESDTDDLVAFLREIQEKVPIAEVVSVDAQGGGANVVLKFYYKSFPPITYQDSVPLQTSANPDKNLLSKLTTWYNESKVIEQIATDSGSSVLPPPF